MWQTGQVVRSCAGRDEGYFLCVVGRQGSAVLLCDGKERPLERPKKKNAKHCEAGNGLPILTWQLRGNHALRRALYQIRTTQAGKAGKECQSQI